MTRCSPILSLFAALSSFVAIACGGAVEPGSTTSRAGTYGPDSRSQGTAQGAGSGSMGSSGGASGPSSGSTVAPAPSCVQGTPCAEFFGPDLGDAGERIGGFGCGTLPHPGDNCTTSCTCASRAGYLECSEMCLDADGGLEDGAQGDGGQG